MGYLSVGRMGRWDNRACVCMCVCCDYACVCVVYVHVYSSVCYMCVHVCCVMYCVCMRVCIYMQVCICVYVCVVCSFSYVYKPRCSLEIARYLVHSRSQFLSLITCTAHNYIIKNAIN